MPPKIKTERKDILSSAFEIAKHSGIGAITAKNVSSLLGTSVAPIFRVFHTISELHAATIEVIDTFHLDYLKNYPFCDSDFLTYGLGYISFAREYPQLFDGLMQYDFFKPDAVGEIVSDKFGFVEESAASIGNLNLEQAKELFYHVWLYTHGIACMVCKSRLVLTEEKTKQLLRTAYQSFLRNFQDVVGGEKECT